MFKRKEEVAVIAILTIITSALLSAYGVYYFLSQRPAKVGLLQDSPKPSAVKSSTPKATNQPPKIIKENTPDNSELRVAQDTLENFFSYLNGKHYQKAANLYGWGHDDDPGNNLQTWPGTNNTETLKNYCQKTGTCLKIKILTGAKTNNDTYKFLVQFIKSNGEIFKHVPYPEAETMESDFNFSLRKIDNQFKVVSPPLYFP